MSETKQDWADEAAETLSAKIYVDEYSGYLTEESKRLLAQALRDEREACARVAEVYCQPTDDDDELDDYDHGARVCARDIAIDIRTREDKS